MTKANWTANQPTNMNYLSPVNFDLQITKLPKVKYFCTGVTLPGVTFSEVEHNTTLSVSSYLPGDKINFDPLVVKFLVDEDMKNYMEIFNWIQALGPGLDTTDYVNLTDSKSTPTGRFASEDSLKIYSDATVFANTSSNNTNVEFNFVDCFPTSLGSIEFNSQADGVEYATCDLTLRYTLFTVKTST
tara:strand:- start:94 stop:654 length:561 start_codon:yes stop_codon:yes gene_type:complete